MEPDEICQRAYQHDGQAPRHTNESTEDHEHSAMGLVIIMGVGQEDAQPHHTLRNGCQHNDQQTSIDVKQQLDEELPVVEANTIVDPRAMMVHVEDAPVANAAVMHAVRLPDIAHLAISSTLGFVTHVEAPVRRYQTRICHDALVERCNQIDEEQMVDEKEEH